MMETEPVACTELGPVNPQDNQINESHYQGELGANISHDQSLQDENTPNTASEDGLDIMEPAVTSQQESQTPPRPDSADVTGSENQESTSISLDTHREAQDMVTEEVSQPSFTLNTVSKEEYSGIAGFSSPEGEEGKCVSDSMIVSDPAEDPLSPDSQESQSHPQITPLTEPDDKEEDSASEEIKDDTHLNSSQDDFDNNKAENNTPAPAAAGINSTTHYSPSDRNNSDDVSTTCSPPSADESEEEKEVRTDNMSCQQPLTKMDIENQPPCTSNSVLMSDATLERLVFAQAKLREELLVQIRRELALRGASQESAQQVLSQALPPLSTVAMELPNKGGAASSQGSSCVVAERERQGRAAERTEGESTQLSGEERQTDGGLDKTRVVEKQQSGGLHYSKAVQTRKSKPKRYRFLPSKHTRMESDLCDDSQSDSGVSADFSPYCTLESSTTVSSGAPAPAVKETPIEKEIRRSIEREQSLRRSRGLPKQPTSPEYVEIPLKKTVLFTPQTASPEKSQGKDRQFAGKKMQQEIHEEVQREQDLVKLGKVPGFYYKGTVRQLKERKKLFEAFQAPIVPALDPPARTRAKSWPFSTPSDISNLVNQDASTIRRSYVEKSPNSSKGGDVTSAAPRGPGFSEGAGCQVIIIESNLSIAAQNHINTKPKANTTSIPSYKADGYGGVRVCEQEQKLDEVEELTPKENPFFKLRSSANLLKVEQDIREAQERERELLQQRLSLYGGGGGGGGRSANSERRNTKLTRSSSLNRLLDSPTTLPRPGTRPPAARQSFSKLGMWPPPQAEEEKIKRPEVFLSTRKKTPLVQRWEASLINGHNQEDE